MTTIGSISATSLVRDVEELTARSDKAPRAESGALLAEAQSQVERITAELARDQSELDARSKSYAGTHSLASRARARLGFGGSAADALRAGIQPAQDEVRVDRAALKSAQELAKALALRAAPVEPREAYKSGIAVVFNPESGQAEWRQTYKSGVAGVWNPQTRAVEWREAYKSGVAGVWNPDARVVEWHEAYKSGVAGVWNPVSRKVEWRESYGGGVAGVWNPDARRVEWRESYKSGVAGVWNPSTRQVDWSESYKSGVVGWFDAARGQSEFRDTYKSGIAVIVKTADGFVASSFDYGAIAKAIEDDDED